MSAGDLERNIGAIIAEYMSTQKEELEKQMKEDLKIATTLVAIATRCEENFLMWEEHNKDGMYERWSEEFEFMHEHCATNQVVIERLYPALQGGCMNAFLAENPWDISEPDEWEDAYDWQRDVNLTFLNALLTAML